LAVFPAPTWLIVLNDNRHDTGLVVDEFSDRRPQQELRDAVDLIDVFTMWKGNQLEQETVEPIGFPRQVDVSRFDFGRLCHHAVGIAAVRILADRGGMPGGGSWRVLQERHARSRVFDHDRSGAVPRSQARELAPQIGVLQARTEDIEG
jgi:hypothetical protein